MASKKREYYDIDLKNQSKRLMQSLELGMSQFDLQIHDRHENKYFSGRQAWRNPLLLRVSIPEGDRFKFTLLTKIWLHRIDRIGIPTLRVAPTMPLKGNHEDCKLRRTYHFPGGNFDGNTAWIKNFNPLNPGDYKDYELIYGVDRLGAILDGDLDSVLFEESSFCLSGIPDNKKGRS